MDTISLFKYFSEELGWGDGYHSKIVFDFLMKASEKSKNGVVLDAGAGYQRYAPFFEESIYIAQEHPEAGGVNKNIVEYDILCDARLIPLSDQSVDVVLSTSSLEHMEYPEEFIDESFRVLKKGGALFINVPFAYMEHEEPYDFQRPTRYGLARWFKRSGFKEYDINPTSSSLATSKHFYLYSIGTIDTLYGSKIIAKVIRKIFYVVFGLMFNMVDMIAENGPQSGTKFPTGWVAVAYKDGFDDGNITYLNKRDFLRANLSKDDYDGLS